MTKIFVVGSYAESLINFRGELLKLLVNKGFTVVACAPDASDKVLQKLKDIGVAYRDVSLDRTSINPLKDIHSFLSLISLFLKEKPDYCLFYTIKPVIFGSLAAKVAGVPNRFSIITGLGYLFIDPTKKGSWIKRIVNVLYRAALKRNARVFFQNPDDCQVFIQERIISNQHPFSILNGSGVDLTLFSQKRLSHRAPVFLLIARLLADKGVNEYVEAARLIKEKYSQARFQLLGWIDSNPAAISQATLESWIKEGIIEYLGKKEDVRPALEMCSVYVLPSYREGMPRTVLEAMAMGRAIITTDVPGCRETVEEGQNGFLVPPQDSKQLAEAMEKFILQQDLAERMGKHSRRIAEAKYDVHQVNEMIITGMKLQKD
ncbi:MAG: glycosyltransferase family 1 protein [Desulfobulbaceae bacterium]|nr:MAG: glycosyltransferase family 1 protein [Desulfobulbaceae bacterium]